jgi:hypothetical protein
MAGTGDLVMTDLRATPAGLILTESLEGRLYVRDEAGSLVVELMKTAGRPTELGLAPGKYRVRREVGGAVSEVDLVLIEGKGTPLAASLFRPVLGEATVSRGGPSRVEAEAPPAAPGRVHVPFNASFVPGISINALVAGEAPAENTVASGGVNDGIAVRGAALALGANVYGEETWGVAAAVGMNMAGRQVDGTQLAVGFNYAGGPLHGLQAAAGANWVEGRVEVGPLAVGLNMATASVSGVQMAAGVNVAGGSFRGLQAASGVNVAKEAFQGLQLTSLVNMARRDFRGAQLASGVNWVGGSLSGLQMSSGFNRAQHIEGAQLGLLNVAGESGGRWMRWPAPSTAARSPSRARTCWRRRG